MNEKLFDLFNNAIDIGDFISVTGTFFTTQRGEQSLLVKSWTIATKAILPLPEKWHGIKDDDERYRKRYLDILMNDELRDLFIKKSKFWDVTRNFLKENGFLEVETPTLETTTGGAEATPFKTHHNDYDLDVYLRISIGELWQKRLMAAGFPKTFEIGRAYRNEGSSPEHLQEFTNMEFYWSFADYNDGMNLVREMYIKIGKEIFGTTKFTNKGHSFDLADDWQKIDYSEEIKKQTGIDIGTASEKDLMKKLDELKVEYEGKNRERLTDSLWKYCRKNISGPAFLINHPILVAPLAKSVENKTVVQMFQPIIAGSEVGRGYSELNDPIDQKNRFEEQQKLIDKGDTEAMMADYEFVEMLEHGMPPTCGFGFGERLFAILADKPLRELQLFPLMRPKKQE
jgi:lysyl-tRNA synthetase class 2